MTSRSIIPAKLLQATGPAAIRTFLMNAGYKLSGKKADVAEAYSIAEGGIVILPLKKESHEYTKLLLALVDHLGQIMSLSPDDILGLIANPNSDILRYKIESDEARFGQVRIDELRTVTGGLYNTLKNSAQRIAHIRRRPSIMDSATSYANACQFGQTEYGSFVLKVFCPTSDLGIRTEDAEPYCREVTRGVVENFRFLVENDVADPETPLPAVMSKSVARSIKDMYPSRPLMFSAGLSVRYSRLRDPSSGVQIEPGVEPQVEELQFRSTLFEKAEILYERYRKAEKFQRELLIGFITDLHKDPPTEKEDSKVEILHQITMELRFGTARRKVACKLMPYDYRKAIKWHDEGIEILLDAIIDKRGKKWTVHELCDLRPRSTQDEPRLFHV